MKKLLILFTVFLGLEAIADTKTDIAICAKKETDAERLICYDDLAKKLNVDKPKTTVSTGKGKWIVSEQASQIDDSKKVILILDAETDVGYGYRRTTPSMILRCSENETNAYINTNYYLGLDSISVLTRLDKNKATKSYWSISTDGKAIFAPNNISFIKKLLEHDSLLIQLTPYGESPIMTTFDLRGVKEAVKPLREACHW